MMYSLLSVSLLLLSSTTNALPTFRRQQQQKAGMKMMGAKKGAAMGAAYFITNEPDGNFVVASDIQSDGTLALRCAVPTGGKGAHGNSTGPDPFFSQGAVKTSAANNMLATVNAGSNTVSLFSINPQEPTALEMCGQPADTSGEFPVSVAFNKAGDMACVLNGGAKNGVQCYSVDSQKGLTPMQNTQRDLKLNQTTPPTGPAGTVSHLVFTEDNKSLVASVKGVPPTPGMLAVWDVAADKSLSQDFKMVAPPQGGVLPFSMTVIPGMNAILATDAGIGFEVYDFSSQDAKGVGSAVEIAGQMATCWSSFSKQTGNLYLTDIGTSQVTEVNVDKQLAGSIVTQYNMTAGSATIDNDIASVQGKDTMYILAANATTIDVMSLNAPGQAKVIQQLEFSKPAQQAGLKVSPDNVQGMTSFIPAGASAQNGTAASPNAGAASNNAGAASNNAGAASNKAGAAANNAGAAANNAGASSKTAKACATN